MSNRRNDWRALLFMLAFFAVCFTILLWSV